jgi:DNA-binding MarR family transcriptional regulator
MSSSDSRHSLIALVDAVTRLEARLKTVFSDARKESDLGQTEMTVLNAVVEADRPPTVAQIGRFRGQPRQLIQRAANILLEAGLIETAANPDHKRAALLLPTPAGTAIKRKVDARADAIAASLAKDLDPAQVHAATTALNTIRKGIEAHQREQGAQS